MSRHKTIEQLHDEAIATLNRVGAEVEAERRAEQAEQERLNAEARARLDADIEARAAARREGYAREDAERRERAEQTLRATIRASFLASNPSANEEDFQRLYSQLRDEHLRRTHAESQAGERAGYIDFL
jgi:Asp-tRNA(Asn)/Glu-tRNA(Gln) amidotransferase A subunit family amidase